MITLLAQKFQKTKKNRIYNRIYKLARDNYTQKWQKKFLIIKAKTNYKRLRNKYNRNDIRHS